MNMCIYIYIHTHVYICICMGNGHPFPSIYQGPPVQLAAQRLQWTQAEKVGSCRGLLIHIWGPSINMGCEWMWHIVSRGDVYMCTQLYTYVYIYIYVRYHIHKTYIYIYIYIQELDRFSCSAQLCEHDLLHRLQRAGCIHRKLQATPEASRTSQGRRPGDTTDVSKNLHRNRVNLSFLEVWFWYPGKIWQNWVVDGITFSLKCTFWGRDHIFIHFQTRPNHIVIEVIIKMSRDVRDKTS